jgi:hypothetical protein
MNSKNKTEQECIPGNIVICPGTVFKTLLYIISFLLFANIVVIFMKYYFYHKYCHGLVPMFDFDVETNVPTFYSSFAILFAAVLLALIAWCHRKSKSPCWGWAVLSLIFLFLSLDEFASIHERFGEPAGKLLKSSGVLESSEFLKSSKIPFYAWILPYGIAVIAFGIAYFKFLMALPRKTMVLFLVSGLIYVSGALGGEAVSGIPEIMYGETFVYGILYTCEELFEMLGIAIFIYALLSYIAEYIKPFSISVAKKEPK